MAAYCAVPPDDPFTASRDMFGVLAAELAGPAAAVLTASELEELLDERGRAVLKQLLQDHYDLRKVREEQQAREDRAPVTGTGGITRTRLETGHGRALATLFGTVTVTRCAWRKPGRATGAQRTRPCPCRPGGIRTPWRSWPRSRRPAAPSPPRTRPSPAAAAR